MTKTT